MKRQDEGFFWVLLACLFGGIPGMLALVAGLVAWGAIVQCRQNRGRPRMVKLSDYPKAPRAATAPGPNDDLIRWAFGAGDV